jgi:hypothetical protein
MMRRLRRLRGDTESSVIVPIPAIVLLVILLRLIVSPVVAVLLLEELSKRKALVVIAVVRRAEPCGRDRSDTEKQRHRERENHSRIPGHTFVHNRVRKNKLTCQSPSNSVNSST